jgi:hypothetical protein
MSEQLHDMSILDEFLDATYRTKYVDQGSEAWEQMRVGRFTSSEIYKLMECGKRPMTPDELAARPKKGKGSATTQVPDPSKMSERGLGYIREKVWETLTGKAKSSSYAYPIVYGKEMEPEAVEHFEKITGLITQTVGFQPWTDHAGGSPDRLIGEKEGLEIKCPWSDEQIDYLMLTDHFDLKRCYPQIYWQCVSLLLFTGRDRWHLCTYDPRMREEKLKMTHLIIEAEKVAEDIDAIPKAIQGAVEEKLKLIKTLG